MLYASHTKNKKYVSVIVLLWNRQASHLFIGLAEKQMIVDKGFI